jgi:hypothetical protein
VKIPGIFIGSLAAVIGNFIDSLGSFIVGSMNLNEPPNAVSRQIYFRIKSMRQSFFIIL